MAVSKDEQKLFIACLTYRTIWEVNIGENINSEPSIMLTNLDFNPCGLSVTSLNKLLIVSQDEQKLYIYSLETSKMIDDVKLPCAALHAIECKFRSDLLLVCDRYHVSLISYKGTTDNKSPFEFNRARHMTLDDNGHIIVANHFGKQVTVLNEDLTLNEEYSLKYNVNVNRVCFIPRQQILIVGLESTQNDKIPNQTLEIRKFECEYFVFIN